MCVFFTSCVSLSCTKPRLKDRRTLDNLRVNLNLPQLPNISFTPVTTLLMTCNSSLLKKSFLTGTRFERPRKLFEFLKPGQLVLMVSIFVKKRVNAYILYGFFLFLFVSHRQF